ncbi:MAG: DUF3488 and transglutaminase-like domain-containing protein [Propionibacteriaceae bacterium]|nr:DUF3488 and transglutaminase-like domain-containing protein [Propionibacteriaceae bacterium]
MNAVQQVTTSRALNTDTAIGFARFLPDSRKLIEAGFILAIAMVCFAGFRTTFDSLFYLWIAGIGLAIGILAAFGVYAAKGHWTLSVLGASLVFFVLGGPVVVRQNLILGVIPSLATFQELGHLAIFGWKELLTTTAPVQGQGAFLVLPLLLGLVAASCSFALALRFRWTAVPLIPLALLFILVIAMGADPVPGLILQALVWIALVMGWLSYRAFVGSRHKHPASSFRIARIASGAGILIAASLIAGLAGPFLPGVSPPRELIRDFIDIPVDLSQYPSPMSTFRKFSSVALTDVYYYDKELMKIEGAAPNSLIRFAVLDSYDGLVWGASSSGFRRVGTTIPAVVQGAALPGEPVDLSITMSNVYARQAPLNIWVPSLGYATSITFEGENAYGHQQAIAYDGRKGQGLLLDHFRPGDVVHISSIAMPVYSDDSALDPAGSSLVSDNNTEFLSANIANLGGGNISPWDQVKYMAAGFRDGGWTDGTTREDESHYTPGHGQDRLKAFLATLPAYAGSDEHYAALFALAANRIGFPTRVVFGAQMPTTGTAILGKDVTIWVEINTINGWIAIPPQFFIPPRDQAPEPPEPEENRDAETMPEILQGQPQPPPDDITGLDTQVQTGKADNQGEDAIIPLWLKISLTMVGVLAGFALLLGALVGAKSMRAWWRFSRGSHARRIAGGWKEVLDRARDLGVSAPENMTRLQQATAMNLAAINALVTTTDRAMFSSMPPNQQVVEAYWNEVNRAKASLLTGKVGLARLWVRITPRSLFPG